MRIDLNSDLGEGYGSWRVGDDAAMLGVVTSASIACGFHAGDPDIMVATVRRALARGVAVGAHPGFADRQGFGRRVIRLSEAEIEHMVAYQVGALSACAALAGHRVTYVKAHGALANLANSESGIAQAIARAARAVDRSLLLMTMPGLCAEQAAEAAGLATIREVYADRAYAPDGRLASRALPGAVITDVEAVVRRVLRMLEEGAVRTLDGGTIRVGIDTICVHGDTPDAVGMARRVRSALETSGYEVKPFTG